MENTEQRTGLRFNLIRPETKHGLAKLGTGICFYWEPEALFPEKREGILVLDAGVAAILAKQFADMATALMEQQRAAEPMDLA